jgi:5-methylcytosine-specific restriction endonuclease McrA
MGKVVKSHWHRPDRVKECISCHERLPLTNFCAYEYTTNQGKRSTRYESRCLDCARARRIQRYNQNLERERKTIRKWREANVERVAAYNSARQANPEVRSLKAYHQRLRKARIRSGQPDDEAVREIYRQAKVIEAAVKDCPVFAIPELGYEMQVDHIRPLSRGGQHVAANLQVLPRGLNMRKGTSWAR